MKNKRKSRARQWNDAVGVAHEGEDAAAKKALAEVLAMSDAEVEAELVRAGVNLAKVDAEGAAAFEALLRGEAKGDAPLAHDDEGSAWVAKVEPPPAPGLGLRRSGTRKGYAVAYAAAAAVATAGVATYLATKPPPETPDVKTPDAGPKPAPSGAATVDAKKLRADALAACAKGAFRECLAGLDAAREADPAGDAAEDVQAARKKATEALSREDKKAKGGT